jgi:hypothetical protein
VQFRQENVLVAFPGAFLHLHARAPGNQLALPTRQLLMAVTQDIAGLHACVFMSLHA